MIKTLKGPRSRQHTLKLSTPSTSAKEGSKHTDENLIRSPPDKIRVSAGSAIILGLAKGRLDAEPTTTYLMTHKTGKCTANCGFCPQARNSHSKAELLSRVTWPVFPTTSVLKGIQTAVNEGKTKRVCIQALNYPKVVQHLIALVKTVKQLANVPVSTSCQPQDGENIRRLAEAGADRIGIPIDASTEKLFNEVKGLAAGGPYDWKDQFRQLRKAVEIFGKENVSTHLIVGLGETEKEAVRIVQECVDMSVVPALFAFTSIRGTALKSKPQPRVESYRRVQLAAYLIVNGIARYENIRFDTNERVTGFNVEKQTLKHIVETGKPFLTSGCPDCNRPFYNEKPSGPIYNYPRALRSEEIASIEKHLPLENT
jgi:biotin synthase-related radical SAM superfamily protein